MMVAKYGKTKRALTRVAPASGGCESKFLLSGNFSRTRRRQVLPTRSFSQLKFPN